MSAETRKNVQEIPVDRDVLSQFEETFERMKTLLVAGSIFSRDALDEVSFSLRSFSLDPEHANEYLFDDSDPFCYEPFYEMRISVPHSLVEQDDSVTVLSLKDVDSAQQRLFLLATMSHPGLIEQLNKQFEVYGTGGSLFKNKAQYDITFRCDPLILAREVVFITQTSFDRLIQIENTLAGNPPRNQEPKFIP